MTVTNPTTDATPRSKALARRALLAVGLVAFMLVPAIVLMALTHQPSATYAAMGALIGIVAVVSGGPRIGGVTSVAAALLAPIAIITGLSPITGAALMAIMTLVVGRMSRYGLHRAVFLVPAMLAWPMLAPVPWVPRADLTKLDALLAKPGASLGEIMSHRHAASGSSAASMTHAIEQALVHQRMDTTYLTWIAVFFFVGAIIPVLALPFVLRTAKARALVPHSRREAMPYTVTITLLTASAAYYFLDHPKQPAGAFMIATILVLTQVGTDIAWSVTIQRVLGTFGGLLLTFGVMSLVGGNHFVVVFGMPFPLDLYLIGIAFGVVAVMTKFGAAQWPYYVLMTPTTALLNAYTTKQVATLGWQRVGDNLVGAVLVILASLITLAVARLRRPTTGSSDSAVDPPASPA